MNIIIIALLLSLTSSGFCAQVTPLPVARPLTKKLVEAAIANDVQAIKKICEEIRYEQEKCAAGKDGANCLESVDGTDTMGRTALMWAAYKGNKEAVVALYKEHARLAIVSPKGISVFTAAKVAGDHMYKWLVLSIGLPELLRLAKENDVQGIANLAEAGMPIDARLPNQETALMVAAKHGNEEAVEALILYGADVNIENNLGLTAIQLARDYPHIIDRLLRAGTSAGPRIINYLELSKHPKTNQIKKVTQPYKDLEKQKNIDDLMQAVENGDINKIRFHLEQANINVTDKGGWTALDWAGFFNKPAVAAYLLSKGANAETAPFKRWRDQYPEVRAVYESYLKNK